jgi:hypothetical protein
MDDEMIINGCGDDEDRDDYSEELCEARRRHQGQGYLNPIEKDEEDDDHYLKDE